MIKVSFEKIKTGYFSWVLVFFLVIFIGIAGVLYWGNLITINGLLLVILMALLTGLLVILGIKVAQKDGYIDGFKEGRDSR